MATSKKQPQPVVTIETKPVEKSAFGGGMEGAERNNRETAKWQPSMGSADRIINAAKPLADARGRDMVQNDGYASGASYLHKDNIVGSQFRLNAKPDWKLLGVDESWAEEFQIVVESRFTAFAESEDAWLDAARMNTFTAMVRLAIGSFLMTGEVLATAEWIRQARRPFKTAIQMISPARLSNPYDQPDTSDIRGGVRKDGYGAPVSYFIRKSHPGDFFFGDQRAYDWAEVPVTKPWGRKQVIHIIEQLLPDQSRGVADMVSALKHMRMTKNFNDITLQNAVVNASFAAAIESELPTSEVFAALGAGSEDPFDAYRRFISTQLGMIADFTKGANNLSIDGTKIPHLLPGTKLTMKPVGTPGGVGTGFEESLLRHISASLGVSYEQLSRDYTKTNYSSARASMNETHKFMMSRKRAVADRFATTVYQLWIEEQIAQGYIPLPPGKTKEWFYEPLVKEALTRCSWIGASRGQVDEMKETQAAILRIESGLSTYEIECARLGNDFREIFEQRARENKLMKRLGLELDLSSKKPNVSSQSDNQNQDAVASEVNP